MIQHDADIRTYTTLKVGGTVRNLATVASKEELVQVYEDLSGLGLPITVIGGGSNVIFPDGEAERSVIKMEIMGFRVVEETEDHADLFLGAGENWDEVVRKTVEMGLWGIEAMSAIPGTVGGTPVQNVGAYGQEIKDTLLSVEAFDAQEKKLVTLSNEDCRFSYRDSIFKHPEGKRYIVTGVTLRLRKEPGSMPDYPGVRAYFESEGIQPGLREIREAIISIRANKLPDPKVVANAGSFFKNPIVPAEVAERLKEAYPDMPSFPAGEGKTKIPAGWLMERAGLKGKSFGRIRTHERNALVLVNSGGATYADLMAAKEEIVKTVLEKFGIALEQEPVVVA